MIGSLCKLSRQKKEELYFLKREQALRQAKRSFWDFCRLKHPKFYQDNRAYLKTLCDTLQAIYENRLIHPETGEICRKLMINMPPRFGKSSTVTLAIAWFLGQNNENRIISVSYNEKLSTRFGQATRNHIDESKIEPERIIFNDIFSDTKIKHGDASKQLWSLEGQFFNYLASSPTGTTTGIGCNIGVIDDLIKTSEEAQNDRILDDHWEWYTNTFLSRLEANSIQIIIGTRWSTKDVFGRLLRYEPKEWHVLKFEAYDKEKDSMLCGDLLPRDEYVSKKKLISLPVFLANYHQKPIDVKGKLYTRIKTYPKPLHINTMHFETIIAPIDGADKGQDYLCTGSVGVKAGQGYIIRPYYTQDNQDITIPYCAELFIEDKVKKVRLESQSGGEGFRRELERLFWEKYKTRDIQVETFPQTKNKEARIRDRATWVMDNIYFPEGWEQDFPEFYEAVVSYQARGKNAHDDAPDWLTMVAEMIEEGFSSLIDEMTEDSYSFI